MIHLDTNVVIALLNCRPEHVRLRFDEALSTQTYIGMSVIVYHELMYGAAGSVRRQENEEKIALFIASGGVELLPFGEPEARAAGEIRAQLRRAGTPIGPYDLLIAAQALCAGVTLVTANSREFLRVMGLQVVDWSV